MVASVHKLCTQSEMQETIPNPWGPYFEENNTDARKWKLKNCRLLLLWILPDILNCWINTNICTYYWGKRVVERLFREFSMAPKHQRITAWAFFTGGTWTSVSSKNCSRIVSTIYNNWMHNIACMRCVLSYMQIHITRYGHNGMEWGAVANWHIRGLVSHDPFYVFSGICAIISQHTWHSFETFKGMNHSFFDIMFTYLCEMVLVAKTVDISHCRSAMANLWQSSVHCTLDWEESVQKSVCALLREGCYITTLEEQYPAPFSPRH